MNMKLFIIFVFIALSQLSIGEEHEQKVDISYTTQYFEGISVHVDYGFGFSRYRNYTALDLQLGYQKLLSDHFFLNTSIGKTTYELSVRNNLYNKIPIEEFNQIDPESLTEGKSYIFDLKAGLGARASFNLDPFIKYITPSFLYYGTEESDNELELSASINAVYIDQYKGAVNINRYSSTLGYAIEARVRYSNKPALEVEPMIVFTDVGFNFSNSALTPLYLGYYANVTLVSMEENVQVSFGLKLKGSPIGGTFYMTNSVKFQI